MTDTPDDDADNIEDPWAISDAWAGRRKVRSWVFTRDAIADLDLEPIGQLGQRALCAGLEDLMFPDDRIDSDHPTVTLLRRLCQACPIRQDCLDMALARNERHGFWGGLTARERRDALSSQEQKGA